MILKHKDSSMQHIILYNKATENLQKKKYERAVSDFKKSIDIIPTADAYLNLGTCYKYLDKDSLASDCFRKATIIEPLGNGVKDLAFTNLGLMSYVYEHDDEALEIFNKALAINPNLGDANWNKATTLLRQACTGDFEKFYDGWQHYEHRFKKSSPVTLTGTFGHLRDKPWMGQRGIRLLICAEQGLGDNIMFARYMSALESTFDIEVTLQASPDIAPLLWHRNVNVEFDPAKFDYVLPLGSICRFIGFIDPAPYINYKERFDLSGFNIGCVWAGNKNHSNDRHRSVSYQRFKRFAKYGNLWSLNKGAPEVPSWMTRCKINDWNDTAKWINSMDLIITIDTSITHMAGALGARTWMIQPYKETDFRWGTNNSKSNIWYSSVDIYRNPHDWDFVFDRLEEDLAEIA
jgi:tetratricopeptide (TPR) repeat protein